MIYFKEVTKTFPLGNTVLNKISFHVAPGEFVVITGPSGAGKTTMARLMIKDLLPTSGEIIIDNQNLADVSAANLYQLRRKVSVIFQDYKIIPDKTVGENIRIGLEINSFPNDQMSDRIGHLLDLVGLSSTAELFPAQLSGGELQRAAIARALSAEPAILFADEPTGNLDPSTATDIITLLKKINSLGTTVLVATHNHDFVEKGTRHYHLKDGQLSTQENAKEDKPLTKKIKTKKKRE